MVAKLVPWASVAAARDVCQAPGADLLRRNLALRMSYASALAVERAT